MHLQLIVCGSHLSSFHGMTINEIIDDGFKIDEKVDITQKMIHNLILAYQLVQVLRALQAYTQVLTQMLY